MLRTVCIAHHTPFSMDWSTKMHVGRDSDTHDRQDKATMTEARQTVKRRLVFFKRGVADIA